MAKFGTRKRRGTREYKLGEDNEKKKSSQMSFNFQSPIPDNSSTVDAMDIDLVIAKAQEQLHLAMEAQQHKIFMWKWAEQSEKAQVTEVSRVRALDKAEEVRASEC